jgi:hypothetical protein
MGLKRVLQRACVGGVLMAIATVLVACAASPRAVVAPRVPLFAYYYIWFDPQSWERAKIDLPQLGKYSSDDEAVMRQHVAWAKDAGIDGFIVGWKGSDKLNPRLEKMLRIADEADFKILMIYQALDFNRNPLTLDKIGADLDLFIANYSHHPSLRAFAKPVMIWSGTEKFSEAEIERVTRTRRDKLLFLGTAKSVKDYQRVAAWLDGNAYYWSSVNVETHPGYEAKLSDMAAAVHADKGLWIAPAAPGFDARLVGGTQRIDRKDGETLRLQLRAAAGSSPDAIGLISWNEFSENSHIEPSLSFGRRYLDVVKEMALPAHRMRGEGLGDANRTLQQLYRRGGGFAGEL